MMMNLFFESLGTVAVSAQRIHYHGYAGWWCYWPEMAVRCKATETPTHRAGCSLMRDVHAHLHALRQQSSQPLRDAYDDDLLRPLARAVAAQGRVLCLDEMQVTIVEKGCLQ